MKNKKVKIVATLGPATHTPEMIEQLAVSGVDVFRLNLSHQHRDSIKDLVKTIRHIEKKLNKPLSILGDLGGQKIRLGQVEEGAILEKGKLLKIFRETTKGTAQGFSINHPDIIDQLKKDTEILIDDGRIKLKVEKPIAGDYAEARVIVGGLLLSHKGFYAEDTSMLSIGIPEKDLQDIKFMSEVEADALAVSFVQTHEDILEVRKLLGKDSNMVIIAKIETRLAVENIEKIIEVSDAVMVARGDLGLAMPLAEVPILQKKMISSCLKQGKPVITATQMLESMTGNPFPTRAEVTDVANAILDGTDAVMLSDETATGKYPLETVQMMADIIETTSPHIAARQFHDEREVAHSVSSAAGVIAENVGARLIIAFTQSGFSALQIARQRYSQEIIVALSPNVKTLRMLNFCWGVYPMSNIAPNSFDHAVEQAREFAQDNDIISLQKGQSYVIVTGFPFDKAGLTNLIHVGRVE